MVARVIAVEPFDLVIFGATGDLAGRKLIPGLYFRDIAGQLPAESRIIGAARRNLGDRGFVDLARRSIEEHVKPADRADDAVQRFLARFHYATVDVTGEDGWDDLGAILEDQPERIRVFYLSTAPELFGPICHALGKHGLASERSRVVVEKPIGKSLESSRAVNDAIGDVFPEDRVYRIDHYLGKETVQNLMALRFANALFEPVWNAAHIDHVQITVAETLGVEGRAGYYDTAGALRDMAQNHLLQLLCLIAMEPPTSLGADAVRDEKLKVLQSLVPITPANVAERTVRGQYRAGASETGPVPGYLDELGRKDSHTETFVALRAEIANWRWAGVPFFLRTGKRLPSRVSEIVVAFRPIPHSGLRRGRRAAGGQPPGDPPAAGRGGAAVADDQGSRPGRDAAEPRAARHELRQRLQRAQPGRLRAAGDGRGARQSDPVHAPRRGRGGVALDRPDPGRLGQLARGPEAVHRRHLGPVRLDRAGGARRADVERRGGVDGCPWTFLS